MVYCRALLTRLYQLGPEELEDGPFGPRRLTSQLTRDIAKPGVAETGRVDPELSEALAYERVIPGEPPVHAQLVREHPEPVDLFRVAPPAPGLPLVHQGGHGGLPSLVLPADQVCLGHPHVDEEHFVEVPMAVHEHERPHRDARRLHVDEEIADALVLGGLG